MMAAVGFDWDVTIGAIAVFIPAMLTVWLQLRTGRKLKTNHGKTIGEHVEAVGVEVKRVAEVVEMLDVRFQLRVLQYDRNFEAIRQSLDEAHAERQKIRQHLAADRTI